MNRVVGWRDSVGPNELIEAYFVIRPPTHPTHFARVVDRYNGFRAASYEAERQAAMLFQALLQQSFNDVSNK